MADMINHSFLRSAGFILGGGGGPGGLLPPL